MVPSKSVHVYKLLYSTLIKYYMAIDPLQFVPIRSDPFCSDPFRSDPTRSVLLPSVPLASVLLRSIPLCSNLIRSVPICSNQIRFNLFRVNSFCSDSFPFQPVPPHSNTFSDPLWRVFCLVFRPTPTHCDKV